MGTWTKIQQEILETPQAVKAGAPSPFDIVRRKYLAELAAVTGHPVIVYATAFLDANKSKIDQGMLKALDTVQPAIAKFYNSLTDEQRARFDRLGPRQG